VTPQRPPELFVTERPVRSLDDALELKYARRRMMTVIVLATLLGGGAAALWGRKPTSSADIPTIKAEGPYRQKPADPGGIDIPNQDVRVYDQLDSKNNETLPVEHLLPPSEEPKPASLAIEPAPAVAAVPLSTPAPANDVLNRDIAVKKIVTTVTSAPVISAPPAPVATAPQPPQEAVTVEPPKEPVTIDQLINQTSPEPSSAAAPAPLASGAIAVQLASVPDETQAKAMAADLQKKYASQLHGAALHVVRADLGSKGIYYRIQSAGLAESAANSICSSLKQLHAGCILVRK